MPRTITDQEWDDLQRSKMTAAFSEDLFNDPRFNREIKGFIKKKHPQLPIPDFDLENRVTATFALEKKKRDDEENARRQRQQDAQLKKAREETKKKYGFTDEAMGDLEKFMLEKNIGDYDVAASYKAAKDPKPVEAQFQERNWNHGRTEAFKKVAEDPERWAQGELMGAITRDMARMKQQAF